jgi:hypothetical protein
VGGQNPTLLAQLDQLLWTSDDLARLTRPEAQQNRVLSSRQSPRDGSRTDFRNVVVLIKHFQKIDKVQQSNYTLCGPPLSDTFQFRLISDNVNEITLNLLSWKIKIVMYILPLVIRISITFFFCFFTVKSNSADLETLEFRGYISVMADFIINTNPALPLSPMFGEYIITEKRSGDWKVSGKKRRNWNLPHMQKGGGIEPHFEMWWNENVEWRNSG